MHTRRKSLKINNNNNNKKLGKDKDNFIIHFQGLKRRVISMPTYVTKKIVTLVANSFRSSEVFLCTIFQIFQSHLVKHHQLEELIVEHSFLEHIQNKFG